MNRYWIWICCVWALACKTTSMRWVAEAGAEGLVWTSEFTPRISAHRGGGSYSGYPENCMESIDYLHTQTGAIMECDLRMSADSVLVLMHDQSLDRTTNGTGKIIDYSWKELQMLRLKDNFGNLTDYRIPRLENAIELGLKKRIIYTWDVKRGTPFERVLDIIDQLDARSISVIIVYNLSDAIKVHHLDPQIKISMPIRNMDEYHRAAASAIPWKNIIAFTGTMESEPLVYQKLHEQGVICILGTLGNLDRKAQAKGDHLYRDFVRRGADILATDRPIEVFQSLYSHAPSY